MADVLTHVRLTFCSDSDRIATVLIVLIHPVCVLLHVFQLFIYVVCSSQTKVECSGSLVAGFQPDLSSVTKLVTSPELVYDTLSDVAALCCVRSHRASVLQYEPATASTADSTGGGVAAIPPAPLCDRSANHNTEPGQRRSLLQPKPRYASRNNTGSTSDTLCSCFLQFVT